MRQQKYTNVMLTVNAILLTVVVWMQVVDTSFLDRSAGAQLKMTDTEPRFPNASQQREVMIEAVQAVERAILAQTEVLSGGIKTEVTNLSDLLVENP